MPSDKKLLTFAELKAAFQPFGLVVQETKMDHHSSAVKVMHDGVPYTIDCYHDLSKVAEKAAKFYILLERHHADIKRLYEAWQPLCPKPMHVMSGGGLQLQAFFSTPRQYEGILYLSHIDDGRFQELEKILGNHGVPFTPYKPDAALLKGPHSLLTNDEWLSVLPDVDNISIRNNQNKPRPSKPSQPKTPNPYGGPTL